MSLFALPSVKACLLDRSRHETVLKRGFLRTLASERAPLRRLDLVRVSPHLAGILGLEAIIAQKSVLPSRSPPRSRSSRRRQQTRRDEARKEIRAAAVAAVAAGSIR